MNEINRTAIVLLAALWIVLMAIVIFLTWGAPSDSIDTLRDVVQEMSDNNDTAGKLVVTLGALALAVFALLVIILELGSGGRRERTAGKAGRLDDDRSGAGPPPAAGRGDERATGSEYCQGASLDTR